MDAGLVNNISITGKWSLMTMLDSLGENSSDIEKSTNGTPVKSGGFDVFVNSSIAWDNLLTGLSKGILEMCFD